MPGMNIRIAVPALLVCAAAQQTCLFEECPLDDTSFLQEKLQVTQRLSAEAKAEVAITPASSYVDKDTFGTRIVHFPVWIYIGIVLCWACGFVHEVLVERGMTPLLVKEPVYDSMGIQLMSLWNSAVGFITMSMQIPISLDFCLSLNRGATESGLFLSAGVFTGVLAMVAGKMMVDEVNWDQRRVRRIMIFVPFLCTIASLVSAVFINETAASENVNMVWWTMLGFIQFQAFLGPLTIVPGIIFWTKVTVHEAKTFWMIMTQVSRNFGLVVGPLIFVVLKALVTGGGERVSPRSMMAWINMLLLVFSAISGFLGMALMPVRIPSQPTPSSSEDLDFSATGDSKPEDLPDTDRESIVRSMIWYAVERPFTLSAVEVSTLMMLEVFYGWDPYWTGLCFTIVCSAGIVMSGFCTVMLIRGYFQESWVFLVSAASSIVGACFLFELVPSPGWLLLVADGIIYTGATVANGIAEGWASRAAKEGTSFSNADYRVRQLSAVTVGRFLGPIIGRFLVDYAGRNFYATTQLIACFLGTRTVYKTCSIIWKHNAKAEAPKAAADKLLHVPEQAPEEVAKEISSSPVERAVEDEPSKDDMLPR